MYFSKSILPCVLGLLCTVLSQSASACTEDQIEGVCNKGGVDKGYYGYNFEQSHFSESRSGCRLDGQISKGGDRLEYYCMTDNAGNVQEIAVNSISGGNNSEGSGGASAELQVACAEEGERYRRLARDTVVPLSSKSTGNGMFEVELSGSGHNGICTVDKSGRVVGIMNQ